MTRRPHLACHLFLYHPWAKNGFCRFLWFKIKKKTKNDKDSMWLTVFKYLLFGTLQEKCVSPYKPSKLESNPFGISGPKRALWWVNAPFSLMVGLWSSRTNSSERPGNQGPKTEDSRSHGRHAQHNIQCCHQPLEPRFPTLLFQICGDQPLWTRSQCLCLPAPEEMKASSVFFPGFGYQKASQRSVSGSQD